MKASRGEEPPPLSLEVWMRFLKSGSDMVFIGRPRLSTLESARDVLNRISKGGSGMGYLRSVLSEEIAPGALAKMSDTEVVNALASKVEQGSLTLVPTRPWVLNLPISLEKDAPPPQEAVAALVEEEEEKPEEDWIEVVLMDDNDPPQPVAGAAYRLELEDGTVIEGYLDNDGKARVEGVPKGIKAKVSFPEYEEPLEEGDVELDEEPPAPAPAPPPATKECELSSIVVECEHAGKRKKKLTLPAAASAGKDANVLEVVGAGKGSGDKITAALTLAKPRCSEHSGKALEIKKPAGDTVLFAEDTATFEAYYGSVDPTVEHLWPWKKPPVKYTLAPIGCRGASELATTVRVYPAFEPSISFTLALDTEDRVKAKLEQSKQKGRVEKRGRPPQTDWGLKLEVKIKYGSHAKTLTAEYEGKLRQMASVNLAVKRVIDKFSELFYKFIGVVVLPEFPNLSLTYEGKFKEIDNSLRVGAEYSLLFKADPLFGITFKLEILDVLIAALGKTQLAPVATFLAKVRTWAKENDQTLELYLALSGLIGGEVGAEKKAERDSITSRGKIEGKLKVAFSAKASVGSKGFVSFSFGAEVGGDTGIATRLLLDHDDKGMYLKGALTLLECKLKWSAWASGKFIWELKESYEDEYTFWEEKDLWESGNAYVLKH